MARHGKIRRGRKFDQVLEGARAVFLRDGFEAASVDEIARAAGVSKATLYSYLPDKRLMFVAFAEAEGRRQADAAIAALDLAAPAPVLLRQAADRVVRFFLSDFGNQMYRMYIGEAVRFPELAQHFWDTGPGLLRARLRLVLDGLEARGELSIGDPDLAADQFAELCKCGPLQRRLCGLAERCGEAEIARVVDGAVRTFLARYGTGMAAIAPVAEAAAR
jgi:TetR/AcrR family transcriptional repressor of mexJK operon